MEKMNIALIAHDSKKDLMVDFYCYKQKINATIIIS